MPTLRDYQIEDVSAVIAAHQHHQCVLGRAATGLGKSIVLAELARHYAQTTGKRVLVLVDVRKLVRQLADSIRFVIGVSPGIEMGDERAIHDDRFCEPDQIVVSTVQTQYSGPVGKERYRKQDPGSYGLLLLDECELFLAPKAREVVNWYCQNPSLRVCGATATPLRSDGVSMANLFTHVAFDRDILWGIRNGWLVKAKQAFVRVSVDFSTLSVRKNDDGDQDYSDEEIASRIANEQTQIELAKGIVHVAGDKKSIVVCPTVEIAKSVAHYIDAEKSGSARVIYGEMTDEQKDDTFSAFDRNEFQVLTSVSMLCKGFDSPDVMAVFNCRKTRSKRLYTQVLGRGVRPLPGIFDGTSTAAERIARIAASAKPEALMVNMVGVDEEVRDCTIVDILGTADATVLERAKKIVAETGADTEAALEQAQAEVDAGQDAERLMAEAEGELLDDLDEYHLRRRIDVKAHVDVEWQDGLDSRGVISTPLQLSSNPIPYRQIEVLRRFKVPEATIARLGPQQAAELSRTVIMRAKRGLCSYAQAQLLKRSGYGRDELRTMTRQQATEAIDMLKQNGWKRERTAA